MFTAKEAIGFVTQQVHTAVSAFTVLSTAWAICNKPEGTITFSIIGEGALNFTISFNETVIRVIVRSEQAHFVALHFTNTIGIKVENEDEQQLTLVIDPVEYTFGEPQVPTDFQGLQHFAYCMLDFLRAGK